MNFQQFRPAAILFLAVSMGTGSSACSGTAKTSVASNIHAADDGTGGNDESSGSVPDDREWLSLVCSDAPLPESVESGDPTTCGQEDEDQCIDLDEPFDDEVDCGSFSDSSDPSDPSDFTASPLQTQSLHIQPDDPPRESLILLVINNYTELAEVTLFYVKDGKSVDLTKPAQIALNKKATLSVLLPQGLSQLRVRMRLDELGARAKAPVFKTSSAREFSNLPKKNRVAFFETYTLRARTKDDTGSGKVE